MERKEMKKMCYVGKDEAFYPESLRTPILVKPQENLGWCGTAIW